MSLHKYFLIGSPENISLNQSLLSYLFSLIYYLFSILYNLYSIIYNLYSGISNLDWKFQRIRPSEFIIQFIADLIAIHHFPA
jgi:hypothetical protein